MDKKVLALLILVGVIVVGYASYYAYATMYLIPEDLKVFKEDLKALDNLTMPEENITAMEIGASAIGNNSTFKNMASDQRKIIADSMRNNTEYKLWLSYLEQINQTATNNRDIAVRYDLVLKLNVANDIRSAYSEQFVNLTQQMIQLYQKIPTDVENGDDVALANDLRQLANLYRQYNKLVADSKAKLQNVVNNLGG